MVRKTPTFLPQYRSQPLERVAEYPRPRVLAALQRIGWEVKRQTGSHKVLTRNGWPDVVFAFHEGDEIGPRLLARLAKHTSGLRRYRE